MANPELRLSTPRTYGSLKDEYTVPSSSLLFVVQKTRYTARKTPNP